MRHIVGALCLCVSFAVPPGAAAAASAGARVIVKFRAGSPLLREQAQSAAGESAQDAAQRRAQQAGALGQRHQLTLGGGTAIGERSQVVTASGMSSQVLAQQLAQDGELEYAVPDGRRHKAAAPNDPLYATGDPIKGPASGQWYLRAPTSDIVSSIDAEGAWAVTTGSASVVVAVLDTGVRYDHADLLGVAGGGNLLPGYDMVTDAAVANDGDGRDADASDPGDWVSAADKANDPHDFGDCDVENSSWHGTQTASLIGAMTNNGLGMASVGRTVRVLPVRVLGKCGGFDSDIEAGMLWAAGIHVPGVPDNATPAQIINMSLGSPDACSASYVDTLQQLAAKGVLVVASAGNDEGLAVSTPANCPGCWRLPDCAMPAPRSASPTSAPKSR